MATQDFKTWLHGLTSKSTPVDADELPLWDSVSTTTQKLTWANLKTTAKTYFDTLYAGLGGNTFTAGQTINAGTATTNVQALSTTQTWNNAAITFTAVKINITDTASAAASLPLDIQVGGASKASIDKTGKTILAGPLVLPVGSLSVPSMTFSGYTTTGWYNPGAPQMELAIAGADCASFQGGGQLWLKTGTANLTLGASGTVAIGYSTTGTLEINTGVIGQFRALKASTLTTATAYTVATLPAAGTAGRRAYVTDALAPVWGTALTGGGAVICSAFDTGAAWNAD